MYIRKFPDNAASYMDKVKPDRWGVEPSIKKLQQQATETATVYTGAPEAFWDIHKKVIDSIEYLVVKDYNGREWRMDRKTFETHTTNKRKKRAYRVELLDNVFDIALNPDEVWLGRTDEDLGNGIKALDNYVFIKHFKDQSIAFAGNIQNDGLKFKTWFPLRDKNVRNGILVKRK